MPRRAELAKIVPLRARACGGAEEILPEYAAGEAPYADQEHPHVASCPRCREEAMAYGRILRSMRALRLDVVPPPAEAVASVLAALEVAAAEQHSRALRVAYMGGITVVTAAAGAAGVLVWMSRRRPSALATAS